MGFWGSSAASNQSKNDSAQSAEQEPSTSAVLAKALRGDIQDENVQKSISKHQKSDSTKSMRSLANKRVNELQLSEFPVSINPNPALLSFTTVTNQQPLAG